MKVSLKIGKRVSSFLILFFSSVQMKNYTTSKRMMGQVFNMGLDDQNFPNAMQFNPDTSNEERHRKTDLLM